jgi:hypothetical protein
LSIAQNNHAEVIYTLDKKFLAAGKILKLPMSGGVKSK